MIQFDVEFMMKRKARDGTRHSGGQRFINPHPRKISFCRYDLREASWPLAGTTLVVDGGDAL
jgi:hypothetical protein